jgi:hypothetical protein
MPKGHFKGKVWVSDENKAIFFGIPKNASASVLQAFGQNSQDFLYYDDIKKIPKYQNYTRFTILRQPLRRFVSSYLDIVKTADQYPDICGRPFYQIKDPIAQFRTFVWDIQSDLYDSRIERQWYFVSNATNARLNLDIQHFLIFEKLEKDAKRKIDLVVKFLKSPLEPEKELLLEHLKVDHELRGRINAIYLQDWKLYHDRNTHSSLAF